MMSKYLCVCHFKKKFFLKIKHEEKKLWIMCIQDANKMWLDMWGIAKTTKLRTTNFV